MSNGRCRLTESHVTRDAIQNERPNNSMQRTALRAAADAERWRAWDTSQKDWETAGKAVCSA